ncbi:940_t:CDS:2, partial [Entrophospora sp. SA101]
KTENFREDIASLVAEEKGKKKRKSKNPVVDESSNNNNNNDENANTLINRNNWKLQSGITIKRLLKEATNLSGHVMRLENWGVIRCGLNISRPKWCAEADYNEIQQICKKKAPYISPSRTLKEIVKLDHKNKLDNNKLVNINQELKDPLTTFSIRILKYLFEFVYPNNTIIQRGNISESSYKLYVINICLMKLLSGLQDDLIYKPGEIALSSIESYRKRKKESDYEQKSDGVFLMCLKNHYIEIGHVEISGGYGCIDKPRSTWDHLKDNHLELWRMSNPASGVLIFERTHKVVVPIDWDNQQIYFFNFIKLLWDLKLCLLDTIESIKKLHEENLANMFEENYRPLHGRLPMHSLTPCKEQHRAGINAICVESEDESLSSQNIRLNFNNTNSRT